MRQNMQYSRTSAKTSRTDTIQRTGLCISLFVFANVILEVLVPMITPTDESIISNFAWPTLLLVGMIPGALSCILIKTALDAKRHSEPESQFTGLIGMISALAIDIILFGGAVAALINAFYYTQHLVQCGVDPIMADTRYWFSLSLLIGIMAGDIYAFIALPSD